MDDMQAGTVEARRNVATGAIGVVLSGGGSRATSFHLGAFEYLDRRGLLPRVRMLSTVSGGSFVGAKYALCLAHGMDFDAFFAEFHDDLLHTRALAESLQKLADLPRGRDGYAVPSRRRDLIICAAQTYADTFLRESGGGRSYRLGTVMHPAPGYPLDEVVFNTTEYSTGVAFRFQRNGRLGNVNVCPAEDKMECAACGSVADVPEDRAAVCANCNAALHSCRNCVSQGPGGGCRNEAVIQAGAEPVDARAANACDWYAARPVGPAVLERLREEAEAVRVADVVAASSCLPGVFGPLGFPDDFAWPEGRVPPTIRAVFSHGGRPRPVTLMDGGIYDNQGIESLMLADRGVDRDALAQHILSTVLGEGRDRDEDEPSDPDPHPSRLDIVIVSDADRREPASLHHGILGYDQRYVDPSMPPAPKGLSLGGLVTLARALMVLCPLAALMVFFNVAEDVLSGGDDWWEYLLYGVLMVLASGTGYALWRARSEFKQLRDAIPQSDDTTWEKLRQLRLRSLRDSVALGLAGVGATLNVVMPKRLRELGYWVLYTDRHYQNKRISNLVYHLQTGNADSRRGMRLFLRRHRLPVPGPASLGGDGTPGGEALQLIIDAAATMSTQFWFDPAEHEPPDQRGRTQLDGVLVCGEATMCYNLMKFIDRVHGPDRAAWPAEVAALFDELVADWKTLNQDPQALLEQRFERAGVPRAGRREAA